jgi:hypothetical protein
MIMVDVGADSSLTFGRRSAAMVISGSATCV